jgi:hypothetical protein
MKYYLFLDECGDHSLSKPFQDFPIFLLCGVLTSVENYEMIRQSINNLKEKFGVIRKLFSIPEIFVNARKSSMYYLI